MTMVSGDVLDLGVGFAVDINAGMGLGVDVEVGVSLEGRGGVVGNLKVVWRSCGGG
jgi:hypothetical protein